MQPRPWTLCLYSTVYSYTTIHMRHAHTGGVAAGSRPAGRASAYFLGMLLGWLRGAGARRIAQDPRSKCKICRRGLTQLPSAKRPFAVTVTVLLKKVCRKIKKHANHRHSRRPSRLPGQRAARDRPALPWRTYVRLAHSHALELLIAAAGVAPSGYPAADALAASLLLYLLLFGQVVLTVRRHPLHIHMCTYSHMRAIIAPL